jgi:hypothetical protein
MVHRVADSFPGGDWREIETRIFVPTVASKSIPTGRPQQIWMRWTA